MGSSPYARALEYLYARTTGGVRLGLERTTALLDALGNPHRAVPAIHIAGTNGKGSTVAAMARLLTHKGMRVATYTSPHLIDFRERIVVDGVAISEEEVVEFIARHVDVIERLGATFFEATTAMAFDHFARVNADVAVIETGLGGRLDSTNVVDPLVAVVTSIGLDHMDLLGSTIEEIAIEKAGIFKPSRPAVIGESWPDTLAQLEGLARSAGAGPILSVARETRVSHTRVSTDGTRFNVIGGGQEAEIRIGLIGSHQPANALTAWLALWAAGGRFSMPISDVTPALGDMVLPGRFHRVGNVIFDVAHNPAGASVVAGTLRSLDVPTPIVALVGILGDKDWRPMLSSIASVATEIIATTPPTAPAERRWHLEDVNRFARDAGLELRTIADFDDALHTATADPTRTTLITGSFHTVGDAMSRLQVNPLAR
ncbi:MAG TPA: folylpolyglutamate synthase/dihydrofolate synthase family protein [Gemmatimonadaceae bacterium]|nr:folylpolyglutamate synthase/dihydrofolate synthase family protein [Gemmatimonadaceae bacterium]